MFSYATTAASTSLNAIQSPQQQMIKRRSGFAGLAAVPACFIHERIVSTGGAALHNAPLGTSLKNTPVELFDRSHWQIVYGANF